MNSNNFSNNDSTNLFFVESEKLKNSIKNFTEDFEDIPMSEIVDLYYKVINVTSLAKFSRESIQSSDEIKSNEILEIEKYVEDNFNQSLHPKILKKLKNNTEKARINLKEFQTGQKQKTKDEIEKQAEMYEELRKIMSTTEFVEQYNKILEQT